MKSYPTNVFEWRFSLCKALWEINHVSWISFFINNDQNILGFGLITFNEVPSINNNFSAILFLKLIVDTGYNLKVHLNKLSHIVIVVWIVSHWKRCFTSILYVAQIIDYCDESEMKQKVFVQHEKA